jgi:hypothetical protein
METIPEGTATKKGHLISKGDIMSQSQLAIDGATCAWRIHNEAGIGIL